VPGPGFDVVPTDCLAGYVASNLERPVSLANRAARARQRISRYLRTAISQVSQPVLCRREGAIVALGGRRVVFAMGKPRITGGR
jgi:hypothetical protein